MKAPSVEQFAEFMRSLPSANQAAGFEGARISINDSSVSVGIAKQLSGLSHRPPAGMTIYKFGSRSVVGGYVMDDGMAVVLKYYQPAGAFKHLAYGIKGSRCFQSWLAGLAMNHASIPTPQPLMIAEWHKLGGTWLSKSFLATARADGTSLREFVTSHDEGDPLSFVVAENLKTAFAAFATYRGVHGDLKADNIIVTPGGDISFIDLDAVEFLLPHARWNSLRERDCKRFHDNWKNNPAAQRSFANVFERI